MKLKQALIIGAIFTTSFGVAQAQTAAAPAPTTTDAATATSPATEMPTTEKLLTSTKDADIVLYTLGAHQTHTFKPFSLRSEAIVLTPTAKLQVTFNGAKKKTVIAEFKQCDLYHQHRLGAPREVTNMSDTPVQFVFVNFKDQHACHGHKGGKATKAKILPVTAITKTPAAAE